MVKPILFVFFPIISISLLSCKKFVEVGKPRTQLSSAALFTSDATATGAIFAIYSQIEAQGMLYRQITNTGLSSDEFKLRSTEPSYTDLALNNLTSNNSLIRGHWNNYYQMIYATNAVLEGLLKPTGISEPVKRQLQGEALTIRSLLYYYLVNLYGEVPLVTQTDYTVNATLQRSSVDDVYALITSDLTEAISLLDDNYKDAANSTTTERSRPNKAAAQALLARVYLYAGNWTKANELATAVIDNPLYSLPASLNNVFLKNNMEQIWQVQPVLVNFNTFIGNQLILNGAPTLFFLDSTLVKDFRAGDKRRTDWIGQLVDGTTTWYFPNKYKVRSSAIITEYTSVLRLAEQYLIRAEARAKLNNLSGGEQDLSIVRTRAGLVALSGLTQEALLDSINSERRFELFAESGDRWFNLKRTGKVTAVLTALKGSNWAATDALYPVPFEERLRNPNLSQNPGY